MSPYRTKIEVEKPKVERLKRTNFDGLAEEYKKRIAWNATVIVMLLVFLTTTIVCGADVICIVEVTLGLVYYVLSLLDSIFALEDHLE